jgi:hypothetical protein
MLKKLLYTLLLFISALTYGQRTNSSPYSFFGIGQKYSDQTVEQASMGGMGVSFSNVYHLNALNPAANAHLRFATYSVGVNVNELTIKDNLDSQKSTSTSISYINIGFPVGKKAGVLFGLKPNTSVGYSLLNLANDANGDVTEATRFFGTGGTSKIYGAYGIQVLKNLDLGIEAEYVFGEVENSILNQRTGVLLGTVNNERTKVRGTGLKLGLLYGKEFANKLRMNIGASLKLENNLTTSGSEYLYSAFILPDGSESPRDTVYASEISGNLKNPLKTTVGVGLGKANKWYAAVDFESQDALDIEGSLLTASSSYAYGKSNRVSIGGFYIPKINSISSYWQRVTYRGGLRFENTGLLVSGGNTGGFTEVKDFGISFGLGLPLKDLSNLNLGVEYGKKGTTMNNLIQENYFNFKLSLSLNAIGNLAWFQKRKID